MQSLINQESASLPKDTWWRVYYNGFVLSQIRDWPKKQKCDRSDYFVEYIDNDYEELDDILSDFRIFSHFQTIDKTAYLEILTEEDKREQHRDNQIYFHQAHLARERIITFEELVTAAQEWTQKLMTRKRKYGDYLKYGNQYDFVRMPKYIPLDHNS